jgi:AraC family transcriptional regulator, arabinose operon regulatory protein
MKKMQRDTEVLLALKGQYLTEGEKKIVASHTIECRSGVCYNVDLHGRLGVVCAGIQVSTKDYSFKLSDYPFYRLTLTVSGQAEVHKGKERYISKPGSMYFFPPRKTGFIINKSDMEWKHIYIHFTGSDVDNLLSKAGSCSKNVWHTTNPGEIQNLFESIVHNCLEQSDSSQVVCDSYLRILLIKLNSMILDSNEHSSTSRHNYLKCYNYIRNNFSEIVSIGDISEKCCISNIYLCRLFKKYAKTSPMAYVTKLKMNKAALLLMQTDYSIKQISIMLAFDNQYYFSRVFKRAYGISPANYRDNH